MADKKRFLYKDYTRRQFLKLSGKSLAGLALSTSMLGALGVTEKAVAEDKVRVWAFPQGGESEVLGLSHLARGYENLEQNLKNLGAAIKSVDIPAPFVYNT